ncbi:MAG TPA: ABC transporter ATP-binding protein [Limnochordia bacterium]|nr:ABC transporter ATP-binding protein [Limnochordia bacterium]
MLSVRQVTKEFGGIRAVDACSFEVERASITGLIGPNGAGKTTLFNIISGFLRPDQGEVWFDGQRIDHLPPHRIARLGLVRTFQIPRELKAMTVLENLMLVARDQRGERIWNSWFFPSKVREEEEAARAKAEEVLEFLDLSRHAHELAGNLSVGQKKLLELARGLMADPKMFLLDEPGAGVNPSLMRRITGYIEELRRRGTTFLLIEHDMDLVMNICDKVIVMNQGTHLAEGNPEVVRQNPVVVEAYMGGTP